MDDAVNRSALPFGSDCARTGTAASAGWSDVKPWLRYQACGLPRGEATAAQQLLALTQRLPRRHVVFLGDSIGRQFYKGTSSALAQLPGVSFETVPPVATPSANHSGRGPGAADADATPGVRITPAEAPSGSAAVVTLQFAWLESYDNATVEWVVETLKPDVIGENGATF